MKTIDNYGKTVTADAVVVVEAIKDIVGVITPAADVVEVVRCKECEYFTIEKGDVLGLCHCGSIATNYGCEIYPREDDFCSYGKRKE